MTTRIVSQRKVLVSLVERHQLARAHLKLILSSQKDFQVAEIDPRVLQPAGKTALEVFVLSHLPSSAVQRFVKLIRRARRNSSILLIGEPPHASAIFLLLRSGVHGFISDDEVTADLNMAIRSLADGRVWLRSSLFNLHEAEKYRAESNRLAAIGSFTAQQMRVIALVRKKLSNKQVAAELGISERTVKFHLQNVFRSLGVDNRHDVRELPLPANCPNGQSDLNLRLPSTIRQ